MPNPLRLLVLMVLSCVLIARGADARPLEVPTFAIDAPNEVTGLRVAVGTDGTMVFAWQAGAAIRTRLHTQAGAVVAPPLTIATGEGPRLASDTRGGYVLAYTRAVAGIRHLFGQRLDAAGAPVGSEIAVDEILDEDARLPEALGLPSGFAFAWQQGIHCWLRRYDAAGTPLGESLLVGENGYLFPLSAAALDDGGIVMLWHDPSVHTFTVRSFNADGSVRAGPVLLSNALNIQAIAPTTSGGFVAAADVLLRTLRVVEFDAGFTILRQRDLVTVPLGDRPFPALARGTLGRWLVVHATARYDTNYTTLQGWLPARAQPLAADLTPLEPSFPLATNPATQVATALLPSGSFVDAWTSPSPTVRGYADVVSLCTPDVHSCGDGVLDPRCEECDDGAGNDDASPDACRTTCELPSCGDGVADGGEACDDGDVSPCDGCDDTCQPVAGLACGDGVLVAGCADQCDDGNPIAGDGCAPICTLERVPGGGSTRDDCLGEWIVANPTNVPLVDGRGRMRRIQRCVDDDPACDFDGGVAGTCTFRVAVCANNGDVAGCTPAPLTAFVLAKPSASQALRHPALAAVRAAFAGASAALTGTATPDVCTGTLDVVVPLRGSAPTYAPGKVTLGTVATAGVRRDKDTLKLICTP